MPRGDARLSKSNGGQGTGPNGAGPGSGAGRGMSRAGGRGRMGGPFAAGPGGNCVCPACGHKEPHVQGQSCNQKKCPKCGAFLTRN